MTTAQGAQYLGLSARHVRELISRGALPATKEETPRGEVYWLQRSDLDAFRTAREEQAAVTPAGSEKRKRGRPPKPLRQDGN